MQFADAHVHLADPEYEGLLPCLIETAKRANVSALVSNAMDSETSRRTLALAQEYSDLVYAAVGIHPWNAVSQEETDLEAVSEIATRGRRQIVAIGEIGLDRIYAKEEKHFQIQSEIFRKMLDLAERTGLPIIVHSRGSIQETLGFIGTSRVKQVLFHWYSGSIEALKEIISEGYRITVGPSLLYSKHIQEIVKSTPIECVLTETDGPVTYGGPFQRKLTTPEFLPIVVEELAKTIGSRVEDVSGQLVRNFESFFKVETSSKP
jgi:TatD DNase family protein